MCIQDELTYLKACPIKLVLRSSERFSVAAKGEANHILEDEEIYGGSLVEPVDELGKHKGHYMTRVIISLSHVRLTKALTGRTADYAFRSKARFVHLI